MAGIGTSSYVYVLSDPGQVHLPYIINPIKYITRTFFGARDDLFGARDDRCSCDELIN